MQMIVTLQTDINPITPDMPSSSNRLKLILSEPFRVFFPVGMIFGITSVMLWLLYELGWLSVYPSVMHARMLILGFIGMFVMGFLGTAFPRLVGVKGMGMSHFAGCLILMVVSQSLYLANRVFLADLVSLLLWSLAIAVAGSRLPKRTDMPPPGFVLVVTALLSLWFSLFLRVYAGLFSELGTWSFSLSRILMYEAFPTLLILGVAPYFFPKILGGPNRHEFEESRYPPKGWIKPACRALVAAIVAMSGYVWKLQEPQGGCIVVSVAVAIYLLMEVPLRPNDSSHRGSMAWGLLIGMIGIVIGTVTPAFFPQYRIGVFHLFVVGGVSLILMTVSLRVVHGHAGDVLKTQGRKWWIISLWILLPVAGFTRLSADLMPSTRSSHLIYAAVIFTLSAVFWLCGNGSFFLREEAPEEVSGKLKTPERKSPKLIEK